MGRVVFDLHIQNRGQAAEPLGTNTQLIHLVKQFQTQLLGTVGGATGLQVMDINRIQQRLLGQLHCFFSSAAYANTQHARRTPASAHLRHHFQHPVHHGIRWVQHGEF